MKEETARWGTRYRSRRCWWQCAKGPQWRTTRATLLLVDGNGNITRLAWLARRRLDCTRASAAKEKSKTRIVRPAARGNAGSGCCQRKQGQNPAKMAPSFAATDTSVRLLNSIPWLWSWPTRSTRFLTLRPSRSSFQTTSVLPSRNASRAFENSGHSAWLPHVFS